VKVASRPSEILPKLRSLAGFCLSEMIELYEVRLSFFFFLPGQPRKANQIYLRLKNIYKYTKLLLQQEAVEVMEIVTGATSQKPKITLRDYSPIFLKTPASFQIATSSLIEPNRKPAERRWF
jgi:hypothetical protein